MSAPAPKKSKTEKAKERRIKRVKPLEIPLVTFEAPTLFDAEFTLPSLNKLGLGSARKLQSAEGLDEMFRLCDEFGREDEKLALEELGVDEVEEFVDYWSDASDEIDLPKSGG